MSTPRPGNRLLSALPHAEFARLTARMTDVTLGQKDLLYRPAMVYYSSDEGRIRWARMFKGL